MPPGVFFHALLHVFNSNSWASDTGIWWIFAFPPFLRCCCRGCCCHGVSLSLSLSLSLALASAFLLSLSLSLLLLLLGCFCCCCCLVVFAPRIFLGRRGRNNPRLVEVCKFFRASVFSCIVSCLVLHFFSAVSRRLSFSKRTNQQGLLATWIHGGGDHCWVYIVSWLFFGICAKGAVSNVKVKLFCCSSNEGDKGFMVGCSQPWERRAVCAIRVG